MNKICEVLGTPSQSEWPEGYQLANQIGYKFPLHKGHKLKLFIPTASDNAINLLESMLCFNPVKRPSAIKCLQHPFFQCYDILTFFGLKVSLGGKEERKESGNKRNNNNSIVNNIFSMSAMSNSNSKINNNNNNNNLSGSVSNKDTKGYKSNKLQFEDFFNS